MTAPLVSIIVTHHLNENDPYLRATVESLLKTQNVPFELIIVSDAPKEPRWIPNDSRILLCLQRKELDNASKKVHWAIEKAYSKESKYFFLVSDDVMVSKWCLPQLVSSAGDQHCIMNPRSNNELNGRFFMRMTLGDLECRNQMNLEDLKGNYELVTDRLPTEEILIPVDFVSFFCTLIPRKTWELVGKLDERLDYRHNDQDYCYRARKHGILSLINLGAFALHFGSKTLNKVATPEDLNQCTEIFREKLEKQA